MGWGWGERVGVGQTGCQHVTVRGWVAARLVKLGAGQAAGPLTTGGRERATKRVVLGRMSMDRKRTRAAEEKWLREMASRRMSGMSAMVMNHSANTALMASRSYSSLTTLRKKPSPSPSPSPSPAGWGCGQAEGTLRDG